MDRVFRRTVVEVREGLHSEIRKLALLNDIKIYVLANAIIEEFLKDEERVKALIKNFTIFEATPLRPCGALRMLIRVVWLSC